MNIQQTLLATFKQLFFERPARKKTPADLLAELENGALTVQQRISAAPDKPRNRHQIRHIVGLEQWGERRLRAALGQPIVNDEMDSHMPAEHLSWDELKTTFSATRRQTLQTVRELIDAGALNQTVEHNQFGAMTARAWIEYLRAHAARESMLVR